MAKIFQNGFKLPEKKEEIEEYTKMAYNTFCVNFVDKIKNDLNFIKEIKDGRIYFKIDIPPIIDKRKEWDKKGEEKKEKRDLKPLSNNNRGDK